MLAPHTTSTEPPTDIERIYGHMIYLCHHPACEDGTKLFSLSERQSHEDRHSRRFSCTYPSCVYSTIGFSTRTGLNRHQKKSHQPAQTHGLNLLDEIPVFHENSE